MEAQPIEVFVKNTAAELHQMTEQEKLVGESEAEVVARALLNVVVEYADQASKTFQKRPFAETYEAIISELKKQIHTSDRDTESIVSYVNDVQAMLDARLRAVEGRGEKAKDQDHKSAGRLIATDIILAHAIKILFGESERADMKRHLVKVVDELFETAPETQKPVWLEVKTAIPLLIR